MRREIEVLDSPGLPILGEAELRLGTAGEWEATVTIASAAETPSFSGKTIVLRELQAGQTSEEVEARVTAETPGPAAGRKQLTVSGAGGWPTRT